MDDEGREGESAERQFWQIDDGKEVREVSVLLEGLKVRPLKTTRLSVNVTFVSGSKVVVKIKDMGFGEIFKESGLAWEKEIEIF